MTRKNIYDRPFEYRIRVKYAVFGAIVMLVCICAFFATASGTSIIAMYFLPHYNWTTTFKAQLQILTSSSFGLLTFGLLARLMWYSKKKPKNHEELNETVGLKDDWDRVNKI